MTWQVLILAGSRGAEDPVAQAAGVSHKAFASIAGRPMISHVLAALKSADDINKIAVSIEKNAPPLPKGLTRLDAASSPASSVLKASDTLKCPLLITTADNPLLSNETLTSFLDEAMKSDADILAGVSTRDVVEKSERTGRRTYLKFSDHHVSGCNLFAVRTPKGLNAIHFWKSLENVRKSPWKMAQAIGPLSLLQYVFGLLRSGAAIEFISKKTQCRGALIFLDDPLAAHDVDKVEDLAFAEECLKSRKRAH